MTGFEIAGLASMVLNLVLGWFGKRKNDQAKLLPVVIRGVEVANDVKVKQQIRQVALGAHLQPELHKLVKELTKK